MGKELGTYLKGLRREAKITVPMLAKKTGVSKSMLAYIEAGTRDPGFEVMIRYAAAVGVQDISPVLDVYLREQVSTAITVLAGTDAEKLLTAWLDNQSNTKKVLSVDIAKLLPLVDSLDRLSNKFRKVCGQVKK